MGIISYSISSLRYNKELRNKNRHYFQYTTPYAGKAGSVLNTNYLKSKFSKRIKQQISNKVYRHQKHQKIINYIYVFTLLSCLLVLLVRYNIIQSQLNKYVLIKSFLNFPSGSKSFIIDLKSSNLSILDCNRCGDIANNFPQCGLT